MGKRKKDEQELLQQLVQGNRLAMREFYNSNSRYLAAVCSRYVSNEEDIKDVLQESFLRIFKAIHTFEYRGTGSLRAWSARIVVNEALNQIKENERLQLTTLPDSELPDQADDQEPDFEDIPTSAIMEMIQALPTGYRTVFNLYVFEKKTHKEIASILSISENTSASQFHRAKNR